MTKQVKHVYFQMATQANSGVYRIPRDEALKVWEAVYGDKQLIIMMLRDETMASKHDSLYGRLKRRAELVKTRGWRDEVDLPPYSREHVLTIRLGEMDNLPLALDFQERVLGDIWGVEVSDWDKLVTRSGVVYEASFEDRVLSCYQTTERIITGSRGLRNLAARAVIDQVVIDVPNSFTAGIQSFIDKWQLDSQAGSQRRMIYAMIELEKADMLEKIFADRQMLHKLFVRCVGELLNVNSPSGIFSDHTLREIDFYEPQYYDLIRKSIGQPHGERDRYSSTSVHLDNLLERHI